MIKSVNGDYVNISVYSPLSGSSYVELPKKLRNSKKGFSNFEKIEKPSLIKQELKKSQSSVLK